MRQKLFQLLLVGQRHQIHQKIAQNIQQQSLKQITAEESQEIAVNSGDRKETAEVATNPQTSETAVEVDELLAASEETETVSTEEKIEPEFKTFAASGLVESVS